ncbi:hypothetical protein, partial [Mycobacterium tuberculosis]|uniref:hypothetical protein n=1 Tax=Mycobacterium tuberculosis TaxID=1773 RepID=UPI001AE0B31E
AGLRRSISLAFQSTRYGVAKIPAKLHQPSVAQESMAQRLLRLAQARHENVVSVLVVTTKTIDAM